MNKWRPADGIIVLGTLLALVLVQAPLARALIPWLNQPLVRIPLGYFPTVLTALLVVLLARRRGMSLRDLGFVRPRTWRPVPYVWMAAVIAAPLYAYLVHSVVTLTPAAIMPSLALSQVLVAPVSEEIIFRGAVFGSLRSRWPALPAMILVGILFGAVHFEPAKAIPLAVVGALFAYLVNRTGSLWASIAAHAGMNALYLLALIGMAARS